MTDPIICDAGCGGLDWTVRTWGRITHKHVCPVRTDPWCQTHPEDCAVIGGGKP